MKLVEEYPLSVRSYRGGRSWPRTKVGERKTVMRCEQSVLAFVALTAWANLPSQWSGSLVGLPAGRLAGWLAGRTDAHSSHES